MLGNLRDRAALLALLAAFPLSALAAPADVTPEARLDDALGDEAGPTPTPTPTGTNTFDADSFPITSAAEATPTSDEDLPMVTIDSTIDYQAEGLGSEFMGNDTILDKRADPLWYVFKHYGLTWSRTGESTFLAWNSGHSYDDDGAWLDLKVGMPGGGQAVPDAGNIPTTGQVLHVDTGSAGIMLYPGNIGGYANYNALDGEPGHQLYTSNGFLYLGKWVKLRITLSSGNTGDTSKVVAEPNVLVVTYGAICTTMTKGVTYNPTMTKCPDPAVPYATYGGTSKAGYVGIGWGQATNPEATVGVQPFRQIVQINEDEVVRSNAANPDGKKIYNQGFKFTKEGVQVGLNNGSGCQYYKLDVNRNPGMSGDWARPVGCVKYDGGACAYGQILPDSGVDRMILSIGSPYALPTVGTAGPITSALSKGKKMTIFWGNTVLSPDGAIWADTLTAGAPSATPGAASRISGAYTPSGAIAPYQLSTAITEMGSWVNTGKNVYNKWDTCVELNGGNFGLKLRS